MPLYQMLEILVCLYALQFVLILDVSQFLILELTKDGFVFAMDQSMINSAVWDRDQHKQIFLTLTTLFMGL